ncbi:MAG: ABC transporter permease, partial [Gemmatimonadetes bacterium]|nr:ABC transporter permease [Gemmatimonadota bacterium]
MSEILLIVRREFLERVGTKAFIISTLLFPLLMMAGFVVPTMMGSGGGEKRIALVNEGPAPIGQQIVATLGAAPHSEDDPSYRVEPVAGTFAQNREALNARVQSKELDGYVVIPADVLTSNQVTFRARNVSNFRVVGDVQRAVTRSVQAARIQSSGLDVQQAAALLRPVEMSTTQLTDKGEEGGNAMSTFIFGYVVTYLVFFMIMFYGQNVMRSVVEEKTNRIVEVIVSSVRASDLMLGKILGVSAVALFQVAIWAAFVTLLATRSDLLSKRFNIPPGAFKAIQVAPGMALALVGFFLLGFLLYAAIYAALGAAVTSEQEAQQLVFVVFMPLMIGFLSF